MIQKFYLVKLEIEYMLEQSHYIIKEAKDLAPSSCPPDDE